MKGFSYSKKFRRNGGLTDALQNDGIQIEGMRINGRWIDGLQIVDSGLMNSRFMDSRRSGFWSHRVLFLGKALRYPNNASLIPGTYTPYMDNRDC